MVPFIANDGTFPRPHLFQAKEAPMVRFPMQRVEIDWGRLQAKRALVLLDTVDQTFYLEVLWLLSQANNAALRLILDLMWSTDARVSEVLALKPTSVIDDFGVVLTTLKQKVGRPSKVVLARSTKRYISIQDRLLKDRIQSFFGSGTLKADRLFPMCRQTMNRCIKTWLGAHTLGSVRIPFGTALPCIYSCTRGR